MGVEEVYSYGRQGLAKQGTQTSRTNYRAGQHGDAPG